MGTRPSTSHSGLPNSLRQENRPARAKSRTNSSIRKRFIRRKIKIIYLNRIFKMPLSLRAQMPDLAIPAEILYLCNTNPFLYCMPNKRFFISWIGSSVVMFALSYLWHGILLNDFKILANTFPLSVFLTFAGIVYLI